MSQYLSVSGLNRYLKQRLEQDQHIQNILIQGEISNFKAHSSGHWYFSLKDANARVAAVMFATNTRRVKFKLEDGMQVIMKASVSIYEATGQYQLYVTDMMLDGLGQLSILFEQTKKQLYKEGLFDKEHKKQLPKLPLKIAVITARTGAAIHDIMTTIDRRFPIAKVTLFPVLVQGDQAKFAITHAIKEANKQSFDAIILGRGGGSIEDLWAFNEVEVAYAIYESSIPIITGIGHEVDVTIADYVADMRAATPTAAAEQLVPDLKDLLQYIDGLSHRLHQNMKGRLMIKQQQLLVLKANRFFQNPEATLVMQYQRLNQLNHSLSSIMKHRHQQMNQQLLFITKEFNHLFNMMIDQKKANWLQLTAKLDVLSPLKTLTRGYVVVKDQSKVIQSIDDLVIGHQVKLQMKDGVALATIDEKENSSEKRDEL